MSIGFYPRYDQQGASSRYRFFMYAAECAKSENFPEKAVIERGMSNRYLQELYQHGRAGRWRQFMEMVHLFRRALHLQDKLIIEYELLPGLPYRWEKKLIGSRPYILNFDDNVWEKYRNNDRLRDKYDSLCRGAAGVIAANNFLYEKIKKLNENVVLIPTVLDLNQYRETAVRKFDKFTVVWIGTPVTYMYLEKHIQMLQMLTKKTDCELLIVADEHLRHTRPLKGVRARYVNWSSETETMLLKQSHIGIMPLTDDDFSRGKSAFKLLQYQASGLPLIASPVGENRVVVENNVNGFLAESSDEWLDAVLKLRYDQAVYERCAVAASARAYDYSLQKYFPVFCDFVCKSFNLLN